jgi:acetyl-CoA C-acetyltransferase
MSVDPNTPVLIGWSAVEQREKDPQQALDATGLMIKAAKSALPLELSDSILAAVDWIAVPNGTWDYRDPARIVANGIGARQPHTVLANVGVMQQTLISQACQRVVAGESKIALISSGEAKFRETVAASSGVRAATTSEADDVAPDETLIPKAELILSSEREAGLNGAVGFYAILESSFRAERKQGVQENRESLGKLYSRFTEIAADNPHAVRRDVREPEYLSTASDRNPMLAFPYTKLMVSTWTVDQASALVFCTAATADELGVPRENWVFPLASVESNHMAPVTARARLTQPEAMRAMARASYEATGVRTGEIELLDLYSCFPIAVKMAADGLGVDESRDLTITGGMSFAGGPLNNYVLQATCRAADLLSDGKGAHALVTCVSGLYTKQGFTVWSKSEPEKPFAVVDVTEEVGRLEGVLPVDDHAVGVGQIIGCTVLFAGGEPERAVSVVEMASGHRTVAKSFDQEIMRAFMSEECVGRTVLIDNGNFRWDTIRAG